MGNKIELLAPAGNWEAFLAAVENGADAVYLGGKLFNARQFAGNFDDELLKRTLDYAHVRGVEIYLTMNTLIADNEMKEALDFIEEVYLLGIDGIIVQDIGLACLVGKAFPRLPLHASTQMTIYNLEGVRMLEQLGFKRVVLSRELSMEEISHIAHNTSLDIEVFVHGALCISYSGQCLMSSIIGGRSGNRGKCAQPCRLPFELTGNMRGDGLKGRRDNAGPARYLMSPKDLCSVNMLYDLAGSGVRSLKIEGRMKTPEYVATVVNVYRKYLDEACGDASLGESGKAAVSCEDMDALTQIFNRGGFSSGYLSGKLGRDMMCYEKPKNWGVYLGEVISYDKALRLVRLRLENDLGMGDGVEIWNGEEESPGNIVTQIRTSEGKNTNYVNRGEIAYIGSLNGKISKGNKVYRTSSKRLNTLARESFEHGSKRKNYIWGNIKIKACMPVEFEVWDSRGSKVHVNSEQIPEAAVSRPLTNERVVEQLSKTGATPFAFKEITAKLDENLSIPVSELNRLRRTALEELEKNVASSYEREVSKEEREIKESVLYFPGNSRKQSREIKLSAFFYNLVEGIELEEVNVDRVYVPFSSLLNKTVRDAVLKNRNRDSEVFVWLPSVTRGNYDKLIRSELGNMLKEGIDGVMIGNIGSIKYIEGFPGLKAAGDHSLNVFNAFTVNRLQELGLNQITLSLELSLKQIGDICGRSDAEKEVVVYGRIPVMTSEYCPVGSIHGGMKTAAKCSNACQTGEFRLKDRKGMEFPVLCDRIDCRSTILNANVLFLPDSIEKIKEAGVDMIRLNITDESPAEIKAIVNLHRDVIRGGYGALRRHEDSVESIKAKGFTKGHFFRGV